MLSGRQPVVTLIEGALERTTASWQKENAVYTEKLDSMLQLQHERLQLDRERLEFEHEMAGLKKKAEKATKVKRVTGACIFTPWNWCMRITFLFL